MTVWLFCLQLTCVDATYGVPRFFIRPCSSCDPQLVGPRGRVWAIVRTGGEWIRSR